MKKWFPGQSFTTDREETKNPFLNARRTWNDHVGSLISQRDMWRLAGLLSLLVALTCSGGMIWLSSRTRFVPYVVEVDRLGHTFTVGPLGASSVRDARILRAAAGSFITDSRTVTPDAALQKNMILRLYGFLDPSGPALVKMNDWLSGKEGTKNPFERAENEMVSVQILSIFPISPESWQVDWQETRRDRQGQIIGKPLFMRAALTLSFADMQEETDEEHLQVNPLGVLVRDFSWAQALSPEQKEE